ncbi:unnamed protein product, partial [Heterosigma akashiwo]
AAQELLGRVVRGYLESEEAERIFDLVDVPDFLKEDEGNVGGVNHNSLVVDSPAPASGVAEGGRITRMTPSLGGNPTRALFQGDMSASAVIGRGEEKSNSLLASSSLSLLSNSDVLQPTLVDHDNSEQSNNAHNNNSINNNNNSLSVSSMER